MSRFRMIAPDGSEQTLDDVAAVVSALRKGAMHADSPLFDSQMGRWLPAGQHDTVQAASAAFREIPAATTEPLDLPIAGPDVPAPVSAPPSVVDGSDATLGRLRAYIGSNWHAHYEEVFRRLLKAQREGLSPGWTWNWPAAIFPIWFLYRRLYAPFFAFLALYVVIDIADKAAAASSDGGSAVAILFLGQLLLMGFLGDRLLFRKALTVVRRDHGANTSRLGAHDAAHR